MPGAHRTSEAQRLRFAGLATLTVASLLMVVWAIFPNPAEGAAISIRNDHLQQVEVCPSGTTTTTVTDPAQTSTVTLTNTSTVTVPTTVTTTTTTVAVTIAVAPNPAPAFDQPLQEGFCHVTTTTTPTVTETTTTNTTTTVTQTTTTTITATTHTVVGEPTTVTPPEPTDVGPTTVTRPGSSVHPTTVSAGGTAFTGPENVIPLATIAVVLMTAGSGLLWAGSRRGRREQDRD